MKIHEDGQDREATTAEIEQAKIDAVDNANQKKALDALAASKAIQKEALLERLGISADEAVLLVQ